MPKAWPTDLITEINQEVIRLAACFILTRQDGTVLRFTDLDRDVVVDGNIYEAASGFSRSTISAKGDLSVDSLDLEGLIQSGRISEGDLLAGKYDHAEFEMFLVKWTPLTATTITGSSTRPVGKEIAKDGGTLRKGRLGQMKVNDRSFEVEFRGLKQGLAVVQGDIIQPICRVDLFSAECGLDPALFENPGAVALVTDNRTFTAEQKETISARFDLTGFAPETKLGRSVVPLPYDIIDYLGVEGTEDGGILDVDATADGSRERPFVLNTTTDVNVTLRNSAMIPGLHWVLGQDIDFGGFGTFTPIPLFAGFLDGMGYEIQNMTTRDTQSGVVLAFIRTTAQLSVIRRLGFLNPTAGNLFGSGGQTASAVVVGNGQGTMEDCWTDGGDIDTGVGGAQSQNYAPLIYQAFGDTDNDVSKRRIVRARAVARRCWSSTELVSPASGFRSGGLIGQLFQEPELENAIPEIGGSVFDIGGGGNDEDCWFDHSITTWGQGILLGGARTLRNVQSATVNTGTDFQPVPANLFLGSGEAVRPRLDSGALPGGLVDKQRYWAEMDAEPTVTAIAYHNSRRDASLEQASTRVDLTSAPTGQYTIFERGPRCRDLSTSEAQNQSNHPNLDFITMYAPLSSTYPKIQDPGRRGSVATTAFIRTRSIDVSSLTLYQSSAVRWNATEPGSSTVTVRASIDGVNFSTVANSGDPIPGLTPGVTSLAGATVTLMVEFTDSAGDFATLNALEFEIANNTDQFVADAGPPVLDPTDDDWFAKGSLIWTTGLNAGITQEIKSWVFSTRTFELFLAAPFSIQPGDLFTALPGCRKRSVEDCANKFANIVNFRGEPFVPGNDRYLSTPDNPSGGRSST